MNPLPINLGVARVQAVSAADAFSTMRAGMEATAPRLACFCEASLLAGAIRDPAVAEVLAKADWVFGDGVAVVKLAKLNGTPFPERTPGPSFILRACEFGQEHGWRHFFLGGAPGVAERLVANLRAKFPKLVVAGTYSPPFRELTEAEDRELCQRIEASGAQILWVALGSPRQERWCFAHRDRIRVPWIFPVGAAFDFHAGAQAWAPAWIRKIGMEWLFRALTGGRRVFFRNIRCVSVVGWFLFRTWLRRRWNGKET